MRDAAEIQRAHDMLVAIILGEVPYRGLDLSRIHGACEVLCWVLEHGHNEAFAANLAAIEASVRLAGYELHDTGKLNVRTSDGKEK